MKRTRKQKKRSKKSKRRRRTKKTNKTKKTKKTRKVYKKGDFKSGDGMLTSVWGPSLWHFLHTMSFNYPVKPTNQDKTNYKRFIMSLKSVLPCKYCRINFRKNLQQLPLTDKALQNRSCFSKWMFNMHELVNKMLKKKSGLKYCDIRERYEHFRSRCTIDLDADKTKIIKIIPKRKTRKKMKKAVLNHYMVKNQNALLKLSQRIKKSKHFLLIKNVLKKDINNIFQKFNLIKIN